MKGSWVGPANVAELELEYLNASRVDGLFRIEGSPIEALFNEGENEWNIVEIKPDTTCFVSGRPLPIVDVLKPYPMHTTAGLPIARKCSK